MKIEKYLKKAAQAERQKILEEGAGLLAALEKHIAAPTVEPNAEPNAEHVTSQDAKPNAEKPAGRDAEKQDSAAPVNAPTRKEQK